MLSDAKKKNPLRVFVTTAQRPSNQHVYVYVIKYI